MDNGEPIPDKKQFTETHFDYDNRTFSGVLDFAEPENTTVFNNETRWEHTMVFNEDHTAIVGGSVERYYLNGSLSSNNSYDLTPSKDTLQYSCDAPYFEGSIYMRREYSTSESEDFRKLLIKSYNLFLLDEAYQELTSQKIEAAKNGEISIKDAIDDIANITASYDNQIHGAINQNVELKDIITLEMIQWVRDNFEMESMLNGKPITPLDNRIQHINETIKQNADGDLPDGETISNIGHELEREHYEEDPINLSNQGGPDLTIDGVQAVWTHWDFESVGPAANLLGSISGNSDNRLWIGQWMHVRFPNLLHTSGEHTVHFEWADEDFSGGDTRFHFSVGYGEIITEVSTDNSLDFMGYESLDESYQEWISFSSSNGTVKPVTIKFEPGYPNYKGREVFTWQGAVDYAANLTYQGHSGHLATITSQEEADLVYSLLDGSSFWLGGFHNLSSPDYSEPSGGWEWITGEEFNHSLWPSEKTGGHCYDEVEQNEWWEWDENNNEANCDGPGLVWRTERSLEPNEAGPEDCLEVWGFDKYLNDNRCHMGWMGLVVEYEMDNGTNHYEAYIPGWEWDEENETDHLVMVIATPLTDDERNEILKDQGDPDADNDGIVDTFDDDDDNDGINDENDMDDDNDGIEDDSDQCPGTSLNDPVDEKGCSASQIIGELSDPDSPLPGFGFFASLVSILGLAMLGRRPNA